MKLLQTRFINATHLKTFRAIFKDEVNAGWVYCQLRTYFTPCSNVFIVNVEQVNAGWVLDNLLAMKREILKTLPSSKVIFSEPTPRTDSGKAVLVINNLNAHL